VVRTGPVIPKQEAVEIIGRHKPDPPNSPTMFIPTRMATYTEERTMETSSSETRVNGMTRHLKAGITMLMVATNPEKEGVSRTIIITLNGHHLLAEVEEEAGGEEGNISDLRILISDLGKPEVKEVFSARSNR